MSKNDPKKESKKKLSSKEAPEASVVPEETLPPVVPNKNNTNPYLVPMSIIIAGGLIAMAVYFSGGAGTNNTADLAADLGKVNNNQQAGTQQQNPEEVSYREISQRDHIKGDRNAPVKIIEYSDTECPFCKRIHDTLQQVVDNYDGKVAWVYRHAPLEQLHQKAEREAQATECAYELGGHDGFWAYLDRLMEITPSNDGLADSQLPQIATYVGLDRAEFQSCLDSGKYADYVQADLEDAMTAGLRGTPYSVVVAPNGKTYPISGAQPYSAIKATIDLALEQK
ncbi:MAG: DsbA family protein [Candidatus Spechtbacterales bacterium]|nr:DsbA family protein [Candidatus Spechtbacterales bacterium]